jgi:hypothetical protein
LNAGIFRWPAEGDTSTMVLNGEELSCPDWRRKIGEKAQP